MRNRWLIGVVCIGLVTLGLGAGLLTQRTPNGAPERGTGDGSFSLVPPAFAQGAPAETFPASEAGISAYFNLGEEIDLARARKVFRGIEADEAGYMIGSLELPGLAEDMWPHVYITKSGWILAYYSKLDPTSKLMQWAGYQRDNLTTTTLRDALVLVCQQMALDPSKADSSLHYYHFQYPDATRLLIAVDSVAGEDTFQFTIPFELSLYEASLSHYYSGDNWSETKIDGTRVLNTGSGTLVLNAGLAPQFRTPGIQHSVYLHNSYGWTGAAVVFLFR
jgi:hypothetical protein